MSSLSIAAYFPFRPVKVSAQSVSPEAEVAFIDIQPDLRFTPLCHQCGSPAPRVHSRDARWRCASERGPGRAPKRGPLWC